MRPAACRHGLRVLAASLLVAILIGCAGREPTNFGARDLEDLAPDQLMRLGTQFREAGEPATALRFYEQAAERLPESPDPLVAIGDLYLGLGRIEAAGAAYERALSRAPAHPPALVGMAQMDIATGRPEAALATLDHVALDAASDRAKTRLHNARGVALDLLGRHGEARRSYARALEASPEDADVMNNLALSLAVGGEPAAALEILRGLESRQGETPAAARENMALVVAMTGRPDDAASLAATVMPRETAAGNRAFYDRLGELEGRALARAVFLGELPPEKIAAADRPPDSSAPVAMTAADKEPTSPPEPERSEGRTTSPKGETREEAAAVSAAAEPVEPIAETAEAAETRTEPVPEYHLQLGAFEERERLFRLWPTIAEFPGFETLTPLEDPVTHADGATMHRLLAGPIRGFANAERLCRVLAPEHACIVRPRVPDAQPLEIAPDGG